MGGLYGSLVCSLIMNNEYLAQKRSLFTKYAFSFKTRRSMSVIWVACGTCYTKTEGTELGGIELQRSS